MKNAPEGSRNMLIGVRVDEAEGERIGWAAKELGLREADFVRMAALQKAKEILG
ncbi:ribbon-helix-helix DNA binding domain protein [Microbacterium phage Araxxi]|uniref:Ribbon-helix-helix DNA binding domain protein n=1 Tax=Microbacterium phage Araxxi TaxID=2590948 RepID=A0A516KT13_9CAUD|nr:ribbon-helix-helix DNA binding domain protein [Microbacterium phage Araxxi]QDP44827.1 ribbon-helix-helix DNA binding domain protein [Microbacterium phage Araxxi]USH45455.1 ribbon-helix-helix DNA binding domain protein [Microbacterium phage DoTi]UVG34215.1 ribbon-helix-helix DNA binding domain protein [Microbacterium phage Hannabella]